MFQSEISVAQMYQYIKHNYDSLQSLKRRKKYFYPISLKTWNKNNKKRIHLGRKKLSKGYKSVNLPICPPTSSTEILILAQVSLTGVCLVLTIPLLLSNNIQVFGFCTFLFTLRVGESFAVTCLTRTSKGFIITCCAHSPEASTGGRISSAGGHWILRIFACAKQWLKSPKRFSRI